MRAYDAVVVGSGPNGLAAAIRLAQHRLAVLVLEANATIGGSSRSAQLTSPGFVHDVCSAIHPLAAGSPFFRTLPLQDFGLSWVHPDVPLAHPLDADDVVLLDGSIERTAAGLGLDGRAYERLLSPLVADWESLAAEFLQPILHWPAHPLTLAHFGLRALRSASRLARTCFRAPPARALLAGMAAHSFLRLEQIPSAAFALVLAIMGHAVGWPLPRGGAQKITDALAGLFRSLGGEIETGRRIESLSGIPPSKVVLFDVTPRQLLRIAGDKFSSSYRSALDRYRYGPGVFKIDYALNGPVPWRADACRRAGTVHVGGTLEEIASAERQVAEGKIPERPFIIFAQPTMFDSSRAPSGKHIAWAYCHVPAGSTFEVTALIERQIERFAPGFGECILARHSANCMELERSNPNLIGGDINGGAADLRQLLARPVLGPVPYRTSARGIYLCSASTPPGGGVHGMCGWHAAEAAIRDCFS